jgi:hypothetical protein
MRLFADSPRQYYQDVLRVVGKFAEDHRFTDLRVLETVDGVIVQGRAESASPTDYTLTTETYFLSVEDLLQMMRSALKARGVGGITPAEGKVR